MEKYGSKSGLYPLDVYVFNELWRTEQEEAKDLLNKKGEHALHTERNECTIDFNCCADKYFDDPEVQQILGSLTKAVKNNQSIIKIEALKKKD